MTVKALRVIAMIGIFTAVFPFVVLCEGIGFERFVWWHYITFYAVFAVFFAWGMLCASWGTNPTHSRSFRPKALFISRAAFVLPTIVFFIVCGALELSSGLFVYILPAALIAYKGGYSAAGKDYSEIFGQGWFALFFVAAVISGGLLWFTHDESVMSAGGLQLCIAFGLLIVISAILTNQTNIDICTHQRDSGKMALPKGLRAYNTKLCVGVSIVTVGLFLLAPAFARFAARVIKRFIALMLSLIRGREYSPTEDDILSSTEGSTIDYNVSDNALMDLLYVVVIAVLVFLAVKYRRQIGDFFRDMFSFMFKERDSGSDYAYYDEVSEISEMTYSPRSRRKLEQQLYKEFVKETDCVKKYRVGYRLMLLRLADTPFAAVTTDNTDIHRIKGENGLRTEKVRSIVSTYNKVRYSNYTPTMAEMTFAEKFIEDIRRHI